MNYKTSKAKIFGALATFLIGNIIPTHGGEPHNKITKDLLNPQYTSQSIQPASRYGPNKVFGPRQFYEPTKSLEDTLKVKLNLVDEKSLFTAVGYLEGGGCDSVEKVAIIYTLPNRKNSMQKFKGMHYTRIALAPKQYSCFNNYNPLEGWTLKVPTTSWNECSNIAQGVLSGELPDPARATHFVNPEKVSKGVMDQFDNDPSLIRIGRIPTSTGLSQHVFYREKS